MVVEASLGRVATLLLGTALLGAPSACTTTLDPTVRTMEAGAGGEGGSPLDSCTQFESDNLRHAICQSPLPWEAARHDCRLRGAALATVESAAENELVAEHAGEVLGQNVWLGATRDDSFLWRWESALVFWQGGSDGIPLDGAYTHWAPGEPNDASTVSTEQERCLALTLGGNDWNDRVCALALGYVCEWE